VNTPIERTANAIKAHTHLSYDYNSTISVLVGKEEKQFTVHKDSICAKSKFFKAACSERWIEGQKKLIKLPEASTRDFQAYVNWVYTSRIEVNENAEKQYNGHVKMYILEDVLDDYQLRNTAMEYLISSIETPIAQGYRMLRDAYERTPTGSPLRRLLVSRQIGQGERKTFPECVSKYPVELIQEMAVSLMRDTPYVKRVDLMANVKSACQPETESA
jgi:hypothetical protein